MNSYLPENIKLYVYIYYHIPRIYYNLSILVYLVTSSKVIKNFYPKKLASQLIMLTKPILFH